MTVDTIIGTYAPVLDKFGSIISNLCNKQLKQGE